MTDIDNELFTLIEAVKGSGTFKEYDRCRKVLKSDPELKAKVDKYREENYRLQMMEDDGTLQDKIENFARDNMELSEQPKVRAFLDAELALCRMLQEITQRVIKAIDFD